MLNQDIPQFSLLVELTCGCNTEHVHYKGITSEAEEGGYYFECPDINLFTQGDTHEELNDNIIEAANLSFEARSQLHQRRDSQYMVQKIKLVSRLRENDESLSF